MLKFITIPKMNFIKKTVSVIPFRSEKESIH